MENADLELQHLRYQVQMMKKGSDEEFWYYRFDRFFEQSENNRLLKYDPRTKGWYGYDHGVYLPIETEDIMTIINDWAALVNEQLSNQKISFLLNRIRAQCLFRERWDPDPNIDNVLNGLVYKEERELREHTPDYPSLEQIQRVYTESEGIIPKTMHKLVSIIPIQEEREMFIQMLINIIHNNFEDELFLMLYGPKGGGKSTILSLFENLLGKLNVSKTPLQKIGKRFGLKELYNKRVNVNPDLPQIPMDDNTISLFKQLVGNDGLIEVEMKGRDSFKYEIRCFLVFGINQLMGFHATSEKEIESIFRRALLISLPKSLERDTKFKQEVQDSDFLNELYSWLVWMRPRNIIPDGGIDEWTNAQKEKWLTNANPILTICKELYEYCEGSEMAAREIFDEVRENLDDAGLTSQQLQTNVSQALQTMKIYRDNRRGANARYLNVAKKGEF